MSTDARRLLDRVTSGRPLVAPGAANALTARVIADWLAREWGHPSDNAAALLAAATHANTRRYDDHQLRVLDVLDGLVAAYEIQGVLAMDTALNRLGLDHVFLVRLGSC